MTFLISQIHANVSNSNTYGIRIQVISPHSGITGQCPPAWQVGHYAGTNMLIPTSYLEPVFTQTPAIKALRVIPVEYANAHIILVKEQKEGTKMDEDFSPALDLFRCEAALIGHYIGYNDIVLARDYDIQARTFQCPPARIV